MAASALIDTGAILALPDSHDPCHAACKTVFAQLRMPLLTSEAVLTEMFHLTGANRAALEAAWKFVRSGVIVMSPIEDAELGEVRALMSRYPWTLPMRRWFIWRIESRLALSSP